MRIKVGSVLVLFSFLTLSLAHPRPAGAVNTSFTCTQGIADVVYDGRLFIDCVGAPLRFIGYPGSTTPCPGLVAMSIDDVKLLETIAMSAFLSGKTLVVGYQSATCPGAITNVQILK